MSFPKGFPTTEYFALPEGPARYALKKKWNFAKQSVFPRSFPAKEYDALDFDGKQAMREQWWIKPLVGGNGNGAPTKPAQAADKKNKTAFRIANEAVEAVFPRTTEGAVRFIKAWNKAADGNAFVAEFANGNPEFWGAATHRATFLRAKGVKLKKLTKTRGDASLYDWDLLKAAAEGV